MSGKLPGLERKMNQKEFMLARQKELVCWQGKILDAVMWAVFIICAAVTRYNDLCNGSHKGASHA